MHPTFLRAHQAGRAARSPIESSSTGGPAGYRLNDFLRASLVTTCINVGPEGREGLDNGARQAEIVCTDRSRQPGSWVAD